MSSVSQSIFGRHETNQVSLLLSFEPRGLFPIHSRLTFTAENIALISKLHRTQMQLLSNKIDSDLRGSLQQPKFQVKTLWSFGLFDHLRSGSTAPVAVWRCTARILIISDTTFACISLDLEIYNHSLHADRLCPRTDGKENSMTAV
jgi:hypothetical protein